LIIVTVLTISYSIFDKIVSNGKLKVVSCDIIDRDFFPAIDIKLLNTTENDVVIHGVFLDVIDAKPTFKSIGTSPPLETSHIYHVLLDPLKREQEKEISSSFYLKPKSSDRINITKVSHFCNPHQP
jgi:hypothetical protein